MTVDLDRILDELADRVAARLRNASPPATAADPDRYLTAAEVATRLACTPAHVRALVAAGKLAARRDGRRVLVAHVDVERYLAAGAAAHSTPSADELLARRATGRR